MTAMMASQVPLYKHIAIDPFDRTEDLDDDVILQAYELFKQNLKNFEHSENIEHRRCSSREGLVDLNWNLVEADLIYIDGSHMASDVLCDLVMSWNILKVGGVILCDDSGGSWMYADKNGYKPVQKSPRLAVENFIQCYWDKLEIIDLPNNWQTAFRKIS